MATVPLQPAKEPLQNISSARLASAANEPMHKRARVVETINVRVVPLANREAIEGAIGKLVEEWAALTYTCMVEAAMAEQAATEPMQPPDAPASDEPTTAVGGA
jgi:hypothetical protein